MDSGPDVVPPIVRNNAAGGNAKRRMTGRTNVPHTFPPFPPAFLPSPFLLSRVFLQQVVTMFQKTLGAELLGTHFMEEPIFNVFFVVVVANRNHSAAF